MNLSRDILRNRHRLSERQVDDFLDEKIVAEEKESRLRVMQRVGHFIKIAKSLNKEKIWFVSLKGPLLSQRIYGDPTYRSFRDFDILVNPEDMNRVLQLLEKKGYQTTDFEWPEPEKKQQIVLHFLNQVEMVHHESGIMLEIHWKLFSTRIANEKKIRQLMQNHQETVEFGGEHLNRLSPEFELFYLVVHGGVHAWFRLKWLVDIHEILSRNSIDRETFNRIVSKCNAHKLVDICNIMLGEYFQDGPTLLRANHDRSRSAKLGEIAIEQCKQPEGDPHISRANTLKLLRYRIKLFPYPPYKLDVLKVITFCKTDLKYEWLPPYRVAYYLFRPVGYILRGLKILV